jgi:hypothetical protein
MDSDDDDVSSTMPLDRRNWFRQTTTTGVASALAASLTTTPPAFASETYHNNASSITANTAMDDDDNETTISIPLKYIPSLSAYVLYYSVGGDRFGAIVDTGAPFLTIPSYCSTQKYGCFLPNHSQPSGLTDTYERFAGNEGMVEWRKASFSFAPAGTPEADYASRLLSFPQSTIFGVLSESLMGGSGGVFFGLVKYTDSWIRPSFLGQTLVKSMAIDLRKVPMNNDDNASFDGLLTLSSKQSLLSSQDYIPLSRDLNAKYGDPVLHYTARANSVMVNGAPLGASHQGRRRPSSVPIYVIFDTGVSGMVVSKELLDERYQTARERRERNLWGNVQVSFPTRQGNTITLEATKPLTTPLGQVPWPKFKNAHLVVLGLAFLDQHKLTIDIDDQRLWIES